MCVLPLPRPLPQPLLPPLSPPILVPLLPLISAAAAAAAAPPTTAAAAPLFCRCCVRLGALFPPAQDLHRRDQRGAGQLHHPITGRGLHPSRQPGELPTLVRNRHVRRRHGHGLPAGGRCPVDTMKRATDKPCFWWFWFRVLSFIFLFFRIVNHMGGRGGEGVHCARILL